MKKNRIFVDVHVIQTVPPSCVNRDDTGSPKTAIYGGVRRARISSQSWKHAMRLSFQDQFDEKDLGVRTKKIIGMIAEQIMEMDQSISNAEERAKTIVKIAGLETKDDTSQALFFLGRKQAENLAKLAVKEDYEKTEKKVAQAALNKDQGIDIALFGRMVADDPSLNADASAQVAHSISTHKVDNEYDYFTAIDELSPKDNAGAGMIGTVEFNSATFYRYSTVAVHDLFGQLGNAEVTTKAIKEFVRAFVTSMPTGKQNTFANRTLPDAVMIAVRLDQPVNLVGAFEEPIAISPSFSGGYAEASSKKLSTYAKSVYATFASEPYKTWHIGRGFELTKGEQNISTILNELENVIGEALVKL